VLVQGPLGFSLPSAITSVARSAYHVAADPRAQAAAAVIGTEYAPDTTAQVQQYARSVSRNIRQARQAFDPVYGQQMMPTPDAGYDAGGSMPVQHSNMLVYAGIGAGALILFLLMRK